MATLASSYDHNMSSPLNDLSDDMNVDSDSDASVFTPTSPQPALAALNNSNHTNHANGTVDDDDDDLDADADADADADGDADAEADPDFVDDNDAVAADSPLPYQHHLQAGTSSRVSSKVCRIFSCLSN